MPSAAQQVVRFETTVGSFDMVINPTNNPVLTDYANNFLAYVDNNNYLGSWINRAAKNQDGSGFVLQMGGFFSATKRPSPTIDSVQNVFTFDPVAGQPAAENGLSNTVGTVALALPGDGQGGTNQDAGTSSFFVNLADNSFLDTDFTVFAAISDMSTINKIMALNTVDRTSDADFGAGSGNLAFSDVPVTAEGLQVFIKRAYRINDTLAVAKALSAVEPLMASSLAAGESSSLLSSSGGSGLLSAAADAGLGSTVVPEPASAALLLIGAISFMSARRGR